MRLERPSRETIAADWRDLSGGPPIFGALREYVPEEVTELAWRSPGGTGRGVVTWWADGEFAEIVSLHAVPSGAGIGTRLMDAAENELRRLGITRVVLATTNDNLRALRFYVRRGYRLVRLHFDALERVRRAKPSVPRVGRDGIPLRDLWELEKTL